MTDENVSGACICHIDSDRVAKRHTQQSLKYIALFHRLEFRCAGLCNPCFGIKHCLIKQIQG